MPKDALSTRAQAIERKDVLKLFDCKCGIDNRTCLFIWSVRGSLSVNIVASTKENVRDYVLTVSFSSERTDIEPVLARTLKIHV